MHDGCRLFVLNGRIVIRTPSGILTVIAAAARMADPNSMAAIIHRPRVRSLNAATGVAISGSALSSSIAPHSVCRKVAYQTNHER